MMDLGLLAVQNRQPSHSMRVDKVWVETKYCCLAAFGRVSQMDVSRQDPHPKTAVGNDPRARAAVVMEGKKRE